MATNPTPAQRLARALSDPPKWERWDIDVMPHLQSDDLPDPTDTGLIDLGEIGAEGFDRLDPRELANECRNIASAIGLARMVADTMGTSVGARLSEILSAPQKRALQVRDALRTLGDAL